MSDHLQHDAPLIELVARLNAGSLRERVVALRYKRRRKPLVIVDEVAPVTSELLEKLGDLAGGKEQASNDNDNKQSDAGASA